MTESSNSIINHSFFYIIILFGSIPLLVTVIYVFSTIDFSRVSSKIYNCWSIILCIASCITGACLFLLCCIAFTGKRKCRSSGTSVILCCFIGIMLFLFGTSAVLVSEYSSTVYGDSNYSKNKIIASSIIGGTSAMIFICIILLYIVNSYETETYEDGELLNLLDNDALNKTIEDINQKSSEINQHIETQFNEKIPDSLKSNIEDSKKRAEMLTDKIRHDTGEFNDMIVRGETYGRKPKLDSLKDLIRQLNEQKLKVDKEIKIFNKLTAPVHPGVQQRVLRAQAPAQVPAQVPAPVQGQVRAQARAQVPAPVQGQKPEPAPHVQQRVPQVPAPVQGQGQKPEPPVQQGVARAQRQKKVKQQ